MFYVFQSVLPIVNGQFAWEVLQGDDKMKLVDENNKLVSRVQFANKPKVVARSLTESVKLNDVKLRFVLTADNGKISYEKTTQVDAARIQKLTEDPRKLPADGYDVLVTYRVFEKLNSKTGLPSLFANETLLETFRMPGCDWNTPHPVWFATSANGPGGIGAGEFVDHLSKDNNDGKWPSVNFDKDPLTWSKSPVIKLQQKLFLGSQTIGLGYPGREQILIYFRDHASPEQQPGEQQL